MADKPLQQSVKTLPVPIKTVRESTFDRLDFLTEEIIKVNGYQEIFQSRLLPEPIYSSEFQIKTMNDIKCNQQYIDNCVSEVKTILEDYKKSIRVNVKPESDQLVIEINVFGESSTSTYRMHNKLDIASEIGKIITEACLKK